MLIVWELAVYLVDRQRKIEWRRMVEERTGVRERERAERKKERGSERGRERARERDRESEGERNLLDDLFHFGNGSSGFGHMQQIGPLDNPGQR